MFPVTVAVVVLLLVLVLLLSGIASVILTIRQLC
jgi:hypothetical protein